MGEDDESEALTYLTKLEENPEAEADFELLETYAKSDSELVRYQTAAALVFPFTPRGEEILIALTKDRKWLVRAEACDALSSSSSDRVFKILKSKALKDPAKVVRLFSVLSLLDVALRIGENRQTLESFFEDGLAQETAENVKLSYYSVLYQLGKKEYLPRIMNAMVSEPYEVRRAAVSRLEELANEENYKQILQFTTEIIDLETTKMCRSTKQQLIDRCIAIQTRLDRSNRE
ncbi:hypothetical protein CDO73_02625 [Saccharibacillus sp. O23]|uniref:HEAT repeat domain-containing protein n=1 Tax=Saccharibacillus sp. O23 TaxID=2009338 RepID=UPI000B4DF791|nr:HEAT repeat domain-containing protein [Saccharibacillus sp. O23]OWR32517.1 hypothetical protein CDO73_02625 [Saccharibacillus sp. O23]